MTHSYVCHDSFILHHDWRRSWCTMNESWCAMNESYISTDEFMVQYESYLQMSSSTHSYCTRSYCYICHMVLIHFGHSFILGQYKWVDELICRWTHLYELWSKETPPPGGLSYLLCSLIENRGEEDPPWRTTPKIDQFWGCFFRGGPLPPGPWFGNHQTEKPPQEGGFLSINSSVWTLLSTGEFDRWVHMFDMMDLYVWHDAFICVTWRAFTSHHDQP